MLRLGLRGLAIEEREKTIGDQLSDDLAAKYRALVASHRIFVAHFHKWSEYREQEHRSPLPDPPWQGIQGLMPPFIAELRKQPKVVDERIPAAFEKEGAIAETTADTDGNAQDSADTAQRRSVWNSIQHFMASMASWVKKHYK